MHQDYAKAAWWFRRAAERGKAKAQAKLGLAYEKGQGVPQNNMLAHMWLNLAALQGKEDAKSSRDIVAHKMTPAQIAEAERLARVWEPNYDWQGGPDRKPRVQQGPVADEFAEPSGSRR